jgi:lipoprotein-anchoring transpeptidase ErfK/SrfK
MTNPSRRFLITGTAAAAAASCLAGCTTTNPAPVAQSYGVPPSDFKPAPAKTAGIVEPSYHDIYGPVTTEKFPVAAVNLSQIEPQFLRKEVDYVTKELPGTVVIDPAEHYLYYVQAGGRATRYGVGVGREGFVWSGEATIKKKQEWPDWYPPKEMLARRPDLKPQLKGLQSGIGMAGGPSNPIGARGMYLWQGDQDTYFRIHGTNEPWTIGKSMSSGCIRMINQDAIDLYAKAPVGTKVVVLGNAKPAKVAGM